MAKNRTYKGDDLNKTKQDRKMGGAKYEPWEKQAKKKRSTKSRTSRR